MNPILASTAEDSGAAAIGGIIFLIVAFVGYFLPAIVAGLNRHHNQTAIAVVNLFLGWTLIGWVAALAWACTATTPSGVSLPVTGQQGGSTPFNLVTGFSISASAGVNLVGSAADPTQGLTLNF